MSAFDARNIFDDPARSSPWPRLKRNETSRSRPTGMRWCPPQRHGLRKARGLAKVAGPNLNQEHFMPRLELIALIFVAVISSWLDLPKRTTQQSIGHLADDLGPTV
jgi:hypothetical protein